MESETSNLLLRTTWNSFVYCMLCSIWLLPMGDSISRKYYRPKVEVFLDYNLYPKMNCDILIFSDLKNVLFALEMCLSLILTTITYMEWMWIVRKVLVHVWCFYRYHLAFLPQSQLILQRIPNNICCAYTVWSDKHCYLVEFFPTLYNK